MSRNYRHIIMPKTQKSLSLILSRVMTEQKRFTNNSVLKLLQSSPTTANSKTAHIIVQFFF